MAASWPSLALCAFPGGALPPRRAPRPALRGDRAARVVEGSRTRVGTLRARDWPGPHGLGTPAKLLPALGLSFPAREGRRKAGAESRPLRPHPLRPEARSGRQPDVGSCSLFWEVRRASRATAAKPGGGWRGKREGGQGLRWGRGRSWLRCEPGFSLRTRVVGGEAGWKRWRSGCVGVPRARKAGRGKRSCKRRKQRDRRKRQGWDENSPSRGARERARHAGGGLRVLGSAWKCGG